MKFTFKELNNKAMVQAATIMVLLIICATPDLLLAQTNKKLDKAMATYERGEYFKAIDEFKEAYEKVTEKAAKTEITFYIAECYRKINNPKQTALWYSKVIKKNYENPIIFLYYADALKMLEKYDEAKFQYETYKEHVPEDTRADDGIKSCELAAQWKEFPTGYQVEEMKYFNSKKNDYSPTFARDDFRMVYFTSTRSESNGKKDHGGTGQAFSDIFESTIDRKGAWSTPVPLSEDINTEFEEGTPCLTSDFNTMYFTRCEMSKKKVHGCNIMVANWDGNGWGKVTNLELVGDSLVAAHPAIAPDEMTLYFVSDIEGSIPDEQGNPSKDIWKVTRGSAGDDWGEPINLGEPINTPGNELFPYVHYDGTLYFSSNGHIGMGGLDIFKASENENGEWIIENMRHPVNSSADDFGICFERQKEAGFFTSTRKGRSDDIFAFLLPPLEFSITGLVKDEKTDAPLVGATVKSISSDGMTIETETKQDGSFRFMLKSATDYIFLARQEGYLQGKERETTKGMEQSAELTTTIYLASIDEPIEIENIFWEFDKSDILPESMVSLDDMVETLNDNPNITVEIGSHTDFKGNNDYNQRLSNDRAQSVINYLISKGIAADRLTPMGYGESVPKTVNQRDHEAYPFLPVGQVLTEEFINTIEDLDLQEVANFLNRRTEFKVLTTDYQ